MLVLNIPDKLTNKINKFAKLVCQTPEEFIIKLIEKSIAHDNTDNETDYLAKSKKNRKRLNKAIQNIKSGKYEVHGLIND